MLIQLDVTRETESKFRQLFAEHGIEIQRYREVGPGGGNPCFDLLVDGYEAMIALVNLYYGRES